MNSNYMWELWKQASAQGSVDYEAVARLFMDQSYGFIANKAKPLFRDEFRLGFEVVDRNEKATRMFGSFVFRCNNALLYAPVFFLNGEIKPADMLFRTDVKRFVYLDEDWCQFLVSGAGGESGVLQARGLPRQTDVHLDRLSRPLNVKYAGYHPERFTEMMGVAAEDISPNLLVPDLVRTGGAPMLEKLAAMAEESPRVAAFIAENYDIGSFDLSGWAKKQASAQPACEGGQVLICRDITKAASETDREAIATRGYVLLDRRVKEAAATVVEEIDDTTLYSLGTCCAAKVMMAGGESADALVLATNSFVIDTEPRSGEPGVRRTSPDILYFVGSGQVRRIHGEEIFGSECCLNAAAEKKMIKLSEMTEGKAYLLINPATLLCSEVLYLVEKETSGSSVRFVFTDCYGYARETVHYAADKASTDTAYGLFTDDFRALPVEVEVEERESGDKRFTLTCDQVPMSGKQVDQWIRTAGNSATSVDLHVEFDKIASEFSVDARNASGRIKLAKGLSRVDAHVYLSGDFEMHCDTAGRILDYAEDKGVSKSRAFSSAEKSAFMTSIVSPGEWSLPGGPVPRDYDPVINVKMDTPRQETLETFTPERPPQIPRYGDHWVRPKGANPVGMENEEGLPMEVVMNSSPDQLAQMAKTYGMPHIFDHGVLQRLAANDTSATAQIQQYIPDLETGHDRLCRTLFLLRYRPSDFEEAYGKDALSEMEATLASLVESTGKHLLKMIKRFDRGDPSAMG